MNKKILVEPIYHKETVKKKIEVKLNWHPTYIQDTTLSLCIDDKEYRFAFEHKHLKELDLFSKQHRGTADAFFRNHVVNNVLNQILNGKGDFLVT